MGREAEVAMGQGDDVCGLVEQAQRHAVCASLRQRLVRRPLHLQQQRMVLREPAAATWITASRAKSSNEPWLSRVLQDTK
eukprot:869436-Rhodomonas_salina.1